MANVGKVYVFDAASGSSIATVSSPTSPPHDRFGSAVIVLGDRVWASDEATDVRVVDDLPGSFSLVSWPPGCSASGTEVSCDFATLAPGEQRVVEITATATQVGVFTNSVTASASESDPTPVDATNPVKENTTVYAAPAELRCEETASPDPVTAGDLVTFTVTVENHGASATNVSLTDAFVPGQGTEVQDLQPRASWSMSFRSRLDHARFVANTATATASNSNPAFCGGGWPVALAVAADLSLDLDSVPSSVRGGNPLCYRMHVKNGGPSAVPEVAVEIHVQGPGTLLRVAPAAPTCTVQPGQALLLLCRFMNLPAGGSMPIDVVLATPRFTPVFASVHPVIFFAEARMIQAVETNPGNEQAAAATSVVWGPRPP